MVRPTVFLCRGSSCRHRSAYAELYGRLSVVADVADVRCQRICDGPVVGMAINGSLEWFERVGSEKAQQQMVELVSNGGRIRRTLEKRRVAKRAGRLR
jgi:hypothetical protein